MKPLLNRRSQSTSLKRAGTVRKAVADVDQTRPPKKPKIGDDIFQTPLSKTWVDKLLPRVDQHICSHLPVTIYDGELNNDEVEDENKEADATLKKAQQQVTVKKAKRAMRGACRWHRFVNGSQSSTKSTILCSGCTQQLGASVFLCVGTCWKNWHQQNHTLD